VHDHVLLEFDEIALAFMMDIVERAMQHEHPCFVDRSISDDFNRLMVDVSLKPSEARTCRRLFAAYVRESCAVQFERLVDDGRGVAYHSKTMRSVTFSDFSAFSRRPSHNLLGLRW
jgi:hypothetical protein